MSDQTADLQEIIDRVTVGDDDAYSLLLSRASSRLLKLTRKMFRGFPRLRRWEQTDDVFQTAAMRLYRSLNQANPRSVREFFGLAATQIRRTLIDLARHHFGPEGRGAHHESSDGTSRVGPVSTAKSNTLQPETLEDWCEFHVAVGELPDDEQEVFNLVWYSGMQQAEVASALGVSVPTVKRRWQRARLLVFDRLNGQSPHSDEG